MFFFREIKNNTHRGSIYVRDFYLEPKNVINEWDEFIFLLAICLEHKATACWSLRNKSMWSALAFSSTFHQPSVNEIGLISLFCFSMNCRKVLNIDSSISYGAQREISFAETQNRDLNAEPRALWHEMLMNSS